MQSCRIDHRRKKREGIAMNRLVVQRGLVRIGLVVWALLTLSTGASRGEDALSADGNPTRLAKGLLGLEGIRTAALSPDGRTIAAAVSSPNLETNKTAVGLWLVPYEQGEPRLLRTPVTSIDQV